MLDFNSNFVVAALALVGTCTISAAAHSQEPPPVPDTERATCPRSPADRKRRGAPEETLLVCKEVTPTACRGVVEIPVISGREPQIEGFRWRTELDRKTAHVLEHGLKADKILWTKAGRAPMQNGFEPDSILAVELKREILVFLAALIREPSLRRAGTELPRISTIRAMAEIDALDRARRRGTYIETEEFKGVDRTIITPTAMVAGAVLLGSGAAIERLSDAAPGEPDAVRIKPQVWPPGIRITGRFHWP